MNYESPERRAWRDARNRCHRVTHQSFKYYGGRGIRMCDRWRHSYENFLVDMGARPLKYTLQRIDNDGHYEPDNCKWATWKEQFANRRPRLPFDLSGRIFGRLTVLYALPRKPRRITRWVCKCTCGKTVDVSMDHLRKGNTRSCGCYRSEIAIARNTKQLRPSA